MVFLPHRYHGAAGVAVGRRLHDRCPHADPHARSDSPRHRAKSSRPNSCPRAAHPDGPITGLHPCCRSFIHRTPETPQGGGTGLPDDGESELLASLAVLPLEFKERGIWFANPKQSLEVAGASRPANLAEFLSLPEDQRTRYLINSGGNVSSLLNAMRNTLADWEDAYGFSLFQVDAVTVTGMGNMMPMAINHITGDFDEEAIVRSLTELGYRTLSVGDDVYYAIRGDFENDFSLTNPATRSALGGANRIFVGDNLLVVSPDTPPVLQVNRARNGEIPTLIEYPAFASIAAELSDPLTAALVTREATLGPEIGIPSEPAPGGWERPEEWEVMHHWEAFGAGFSKTPDTAALRFSLYYPHPDWAELDAETLVERVESFMAWLVEMYPLGVDRLCETWSPSARVYGNGSTLTVKCERPIGDESGHLAFGVTSLVAMRLLGFLVP